jgi:DNA repair photolyase
MPECGSQILICDIPVRFDTYRGCEHGCAYCFAMRKIDIANISKGEGVEALKNFINGKRNAECAWCDWDIPLHWGGMSDPFQPLEKKYRKSFDALKLFAETQYPFVVSTKNKMIAEDEYLELVKQCNCVVQFSAVCGEYNRIEKGASTFEERIEAASIISKHKRVIIRVQPYMPGVFKSVLKNIDCFHDAGVYGVVFEGMKYFQKKENTVKLGNDHVYPSNILKEHFDAFKEKLHTKGMKFYSGENRLRSMGDDLCCCGIDGLGWKANTANLNHYLFDRVNYKFTDAMRTSKGNSCFSSINQDSKAKQTLQEISFERIMNLYAQSGKFLKVLLPDNEKK